MTVEVEQIDELAFDPKAIAAGIIAEAVVNLRLAQQQAHIAFLADEALARQQEHSQWCRLGWVNRKRRLAGATSPADAPNGIE